MQVHIHEIVVFRQGVQILDVRVLVEIKTHSNAVRSGGDDAVVEVHRVDVLACVELDVEGAVAALVYQIEGRAVIFVVILDEHVCHLGTSRRDAHLDLGILQVEDFAFGLGGCCVEKITFVELVFCNCDDAVSFG